MQVFIGLGSNLGDRRKNIEAALDMLGRVAGVDVKQVSSVIETAPVGEVASEKFLNAVCEVSTELSCERLLNVLMDIEQTLGRDRSDGIRWGNRSIDLDILFYGDAVIVSENLTVPHPELVKRWFVLKPLSEIAPDFMHPELNKSVSELLSDNEQDESISHCKEYK